ncbi:nuclear transport factor 2 family protein [Granulicoccus phenolivorans]|uniref:nuclear transport factor 2 family protein n=1 Tax=Granulicoccus phenolivorans TaxID=266854 RepID=UPI00040FBC7F|nr:nuclear transport factor 2 family protein [Granulicoccus phenolivorans]
MTVNHLLEAELLATVNAIWFDIDHRTGSQVSSYFVPNGSLFFGTTEVHGTAEINAVYARRAASGTRCSRHITTNLHVVEADAHQAIAVSNFILYAADGQPPMPLTAPLTVSDVRDEFQFVDGRWLISRRRITNIFVSPDAEFTVPYSTSATPPQREGNQ